MAKKPKKSRKYYNASHNQLMKSRDIYREIGNMGAPNMQKAQGFGDVDSFIQDYFGGGPDLSYLDTLTRRDTQQRSQDITAAMQPFMNAFDDQVIDQAIGRLGEARDVAMSNIGAGAASAGAFGGSRHALLEAQANEDYMRNAAEVSSGLKQQSFAQAMQQALGIDQAADMYDLNRAGMFAQGEQLGLEGALAAFNSRLGGIQANQNATQLNNNAELASQNQLVNQLLMAARGRQSISNEMLDRVHTQEDRMLQQGAAQQANNQDVLNGAMQQFSTYMSNPYSVIQMMAGLNTGDPRNNNFTQSGVGTNTQTMTPGLLDYLALGAQGLGAAADARLFGLGGP